MQTDGYLVKKTLLMSNSSSPKSVGFAVMVSMGVVAASCAPSEPPMGEVVSGTSVRAIPARFVSLGTVNTLDRSRQEGVLEFFRTNGVPAFLEGGLAYDVLISRSNLAAGRALLRRARPQDPAFRADRFGRVP